MITLPQITAADNWSGMSEDPNQPGVLVPNLDSKMDLEEHRRIVLEAAALFTGPFPAYAGPAWESLRQLRTVFTTTTKEPVYISKGIHQPTVDPHIQLTMAVKNDNTTKNVQFHLNLTAVDRGDDRSGTMRYTWKAVQFTAVAGNVLAAWPQAVARKVKEQNIRRLSVSPSEWQKVKDAVDKAKQAAADKQKAQATKDEITDFTKAWTPFKQKNFAALKALTTKAGDIQAALLATGTFTEGTTTIGYQKKTKTLSLHIG